MGFGHVGGGVEIAEPRFRFGERRAAPWWAAHRPIAFDLNDALVGRFEAAGIHIYKMLLPKKQGARRYPDRLLQALCLLSSSIIQKHNIRYLATPLLQGRAEQTLHYLISLCGHLIHTAAHIFTFFTCTR